MARAVARPIGGWRQDRQHHGAGAATQLHLGEAGPGQVAQVFAVVAEPEFLNFAIRARQQIHEGHGQGAQRRRRHGAPPAHVGAHHLVCPGKAQLALGFFAIRSGDQPALGGEAAGTQHHIQIGGVAGEGCHQGPAPVDTSFQEGFVEGGVRHQHRQAPLLCRLAAFGIHLHHQKGHPLPGQLFADLPADAAIAAEDHVVLHGGEPAEVAALAQAPKVAGFREAQERLDGELHHHQAADQGEGRDSTAGPVQNLGMGVAKAQGAERDQHHPVAVAPVPALGDPVAQGGRIDQQHQG